MKATERQANNTTKASRRQVDLFMTGRPLRELPRPPV